jgi:GH24 family phage-related lysozyme (muramidase)
MATDNIFSLDPINTNLTAPVTDLAVQAPLDTSLELSTRSLGITNFSNAISKLADKQKANAIHNDTITAELAAAMGEEMQGHWEPEAQAKYTRAVDSETTRQLIQNMKDYSVVEGSDILNDSRVDHKTRATSFKNHLLGLINTGKASISRGNALEMFKKIDTNFDNIMSLANVSLAKDKKQEVLVATSKYIRTITEDTLDFAKQLAPTVSDLKPNGTRLTPSEYAKKQQTFAAGWLAQHMNSRWFNSVVVEVSRINTGARIEDIKATSLQIVGDVLLKRIAKNPEIVQEKIMADIMANMSGSVKGTKVQDDIASKSEFGEKIDGINKEFRKNFKATLDALDKSRDDADAARNDNIANYVQDGMITGQIKNKDQALSLAIGITDPSDQRSLENHIKKHFSNENKKSIGHPDFTTLVKEGAKDFYDVTTDKFDTPGFYERAGEMGFTTEATVKAAKEANPKIKQGERRRAFLDLVPIKKLDLEFESVLKTFLEEHNLLGKLAKLPKGIDLKNPIALAKFIKSVGGGKVGLQIGRVLDAQVAFGSILESIVRDNPDVPIFDLVSLARNESKFLMEDVIKNNELGTASKAADGEQKKSTEVKIVEGHDKHNPELKDIKSVAIINSKKGLFSTDKDAQEDYTARAIEEIKAGDAKRAELVKDQKDFKIDNIAKRSLLISKWGSDPNNIREVVSRRAMAIRNHPDSAVRRHLKVLEIKEREGVPSTIQQPMKLEQPSAWDQLANYMSILPKKVAKDLTETSRKLFWEGKKTETRQEIEQIKASPKDVSDSTVKLNKAKQIELNKEIAQAKVNAKKSTNKDINENNSNKLSNDTTVPDGDSKIDIAPYVPPVETSSKDFIGDSDTRKGLKKETEPIMKRIAKILRKWKPVSKVNAKELEKTFDKKDHDLVKVLVSFENYNPIGKDIGDGEVTIGYGQTKTGAKLGDKITSEEAAKMFKKRLYKTEIPKFNKYIKPFLKKQLTPIQRIVVISLIYNLGLDGFRYNKKGKETNAFKALKKGDYKTFKYQAFDSTIGFVKSEGVINDGLVNRRAAEEEMWDK